MKITFAILILLSSTYSFSKAINKSMKLHCMGIDNEQMPLGSKWVFTCNTDPKTKENIWYRYCYISDDGSAQWSKDYTEYEPKGC
jgi:hypothetical protein